MSRVPSGITNHKHKISVRKVFKMAAKAEKLGKAITVDDNGKIRMIPKVEYVAEIDTCPGEDHYSVTMKQKV